MDSVQQIVLQSVLASRGQPFNLCGLAKATKLDESRAYNALARLLDVGLVRLVGERRVPGRRGRGERVYALDPEVDRGPEGLLGRVRAIVEAWSGRREFSTPDVAAQLPRRASGWPVYNASSLRLALELLVARGIVTRVLELPGERRRGRVALRWTTNPENIRAQQDLERLSRVMSQSSETPSSCP